MLLTSVYLAPAVHIQSPPRVQTDQHLLAKLGLHVRALAVNIGSFLFRATLRQTLEFVDAFDMLGRT